ncbi:MAG: sulfurtransferase complex subunit TusB [Methylococcales bacterium]
MLHIIAQSPIDSAIFQRIGAGDDVLFLDKAVLNLLEKGLLSEVLRSLLVEYQFFALADDLEVRGISSSELLQGITVITYSDFVNLTVKNSLIQTWS